MIELSQKAVEKHTQNYKYGLKITSMRSDYGLIACYSTWDLKNSSEKGPTYHKGTFKKGDTKVAGW